jgi:AcrR family transcriptional regulator
LARRARLCSIARASEGPHRGDPLAQVKKPRVRAAILASALRSFRRRGYQATTLAEVARGAGVSSANVYVYFESKLAILYAVYEPWMRTRFALLESKVNAARSPLRRLRIILSALWKEIPAEENGFVNNIVQALSTADPDARYDSTLLDWMEARIGAMLAASLPPARRRLVHDGRLAHLLVMALDGYSIHHHINPSGAATDATIEAAARLLLGTPAPRRRRT